MTKPRRQFAAARARFLGVHDVRLRISGLAACARIVQSCLPHFWRLPMNWQILTRSPHAAIRRDGRFIVADLATPHRTISTSPRNGGQSDQVRYLVNHQCCEATAHDARFEITQDGEALSQPSHRNRRRRNRDDADAAAANYAIITAAHIGRRRMPPACRTSATAPASGELARDVGGNQLPDGTINTPLVADAAAALARAVA
jgi:hypothetical protein